MTVRRRAFDLAVRARAGVLAPVDVLFLVVLAARRLDRADDLWLAIRAFGRVCARDGVDPLALSEAGAALLTALGDSELMGD